MTGSDADSTLDTDTSADTDLDTTAQDMPTSLDDSGIPTESGLSDDDSDMTDTDDDDSDTDSDMDGSDR